MAAALIYHRRPLALVMKCSHCTGREKAIRGCREPKKRKTVWVIDECLKCGGKNKRCTQCKGSGKIGVLRCPHAIADFSLLPYFLEYRANLGTWPDGSGRYYQPVKLVEAFDVLMFYFNKYEAKPE